MKKLYRSKENKMWGGIFGGLGEYLNVDPTLLRLIFLFLFLATGIAPAFIAYIVALFIVPKRTEKK